MQLENVLGQIDSEDVDLHVYLPPDSSSQSQRRSGGAVHPIKWRREYGGLKIDQAKRLKELERENERLKKAVSELTLDKQILKEALSGKY